MASLLATPSIDTSSGVRENSNDTKDDVKFKKIKDLKIKKNTDALGSSNIVHCLVCGAIGKTVFYTANIPSFGSTDIVSFNCEKCGYKYSKTDSNNDDKECISAYGMKTTLTVNNMLDLQRSIVIHDEATISIPELQIQVRPMSGGKITTVEGAISSLCKELKNLNIVGGETSEEDQQHEELQKNVVCQLKAFLSQFDGDENSESRPFTFCLIE